MDDDMFSGIHSANPGPKVSMLMPAATAAVPMTMHHAYPAGYGVPNSAPPMHPAEVTLSNIKTYFYYAVFLIVLVACLWVWWTFFRSKKSKEYSGTALPGINAPIAKTIETALQNPHKHDLLRHAIPIVENNYDTIPVQKPFSPPPQTRPPAIIKVPEPEEDIVHIYGSIPIWDDEMDTEEHNDARIAENDTSVNDLIKEREAFTKGLETSIAQNIKQQPSSN